MPLGPPPTVSHPARPSTTAQPLSIVLRYIEVLYYVGVVCYMMATTGLAQLLCTRLRSLLRVDRFLHRLRRRRLGATDIESNLELPIPVNYQALPVVQSGQFEPEHVESSLEPIVFAENRPPTTSARSYRCRYPDCFRAYAHRQSRDRHEKEAHDRLLNASIGQFGQPSLGPQHQSKRPLGLTDITSNLERNQTSTMLPTGSIDGAYIGRSDPCGAPLRLSSANPFNQAHDSRDEFVSDYDCGTHSLEPQQRLNEP
jgi:hypothetical protein